MNWNDTLHTTRSNLRKQTRSLRNTLADIDLPSLEHIDLPSFDTRALVDNTPDFLRSDRVPFLPSKRSRLTPTWSYWVGGAVTASVLTLAWIYRQEIGDALKRGYEAALDGASDATDALDDFITQRPFTSRSAALSDPDVLESYTKDDLYAMAQAEDIPGRSTMTKAELIAALRETAGATAR